MKYLLILLLVGCSTVQRDKEVTCEFKCTNCDDVEHTCKGIGVESETEVNGPILHGPVT